MTTLRRILHDARGGAGQAAVVRGEAGIGKTRLLAELVVHAENDGFQILSGTTDELTQDRPLGALIEAFGLQADSADPKRAEIGRLITGVTSRLIRQATPQPAAMADLGFRIIDESVALLEQWSADQPVVVAFEDLHWADPATLRAVRAVGRALADLPVALLVTLRPFPERPELVQVIDDLVRHGAAQLPLAALDDPAVTALAEAVAGGPPGTALTERLSWAAGNPLFVIELVKALHEQGSHKAPGEQGSQEAPLRTLPLTILRRANFLPPATLEILKVAAVLGREFSVAELCMVTGRSAVALLPELEGALRAGLLGECRAGLTFRHELMREAIYHDLAPPLRQALHREVARVLTAAGSPVSRVADHLYLRASAADPEARHRLRQAASRSPSVAVKLCARAFELTSADDPDHEAMAAELAPSLLRTGRPKDSEGAVDQARRGREMGPDDDFACCLAAQTLALAAQARGEFTEAVKLASSAVEIAARSRDPRISHLHPHLYLGMALVYTDRRSEATAAIQLGRRLAEDRGNVMWLPLHHAMLALHHAVSGKLTDALAEAQAGLALADEVGTRLHAPLLHGVAAWVALKRGDIAAGEARMGDAAQEFTAAVSQD